MSYGTIENVKRIVEIDIDDEDYDDTLTYLLAQANTWASTVMFVTLSDNIMNLACEYYTAYLYRVRAETLSPMTGVQGVATEYKELANSVIENGIKIAVKERTWEVKKVNE